MPLPDVTISLANGNLGRLPTSEDGIAAIIVSGVAVAGKFALGDVIGPILSLADAEALGITEDYDTTNKCLAWHHIRDFYAECGSGNKLYVMVVAATVSMENICADGGGYVDTLLNTAQGKIRFVGITRVPDATWTPNYVGGFDEDVFLAIENLKTIQANEFAAHRPVRFVVEGIDWQGNVGSTQDLTDTATGPNANMVSIVMGQVPDHYAVDALTQKSAAVGMFLGTLAAIPVHYSAARVKNGALSQDEMNLSDGTAIEDISITNTTALNDKGYVFGRTITGLAGKYWNGDSTACPVTDDYCFFSRGRVIDKAARITYTTYVQNLNDVVEVNTTTGKIAAAVIKNYEAQLEAAISTQMAGEISGVKVYIDPNQNVLANDTINVEVSVVPVGIAKFITVTLAFDNPFTA